MEENYTKALGRTTIMSLILAAALTAVPVKAAEGQVTSTGGSDAYDTAAKVATINWSTSNNVVLVCGEGYADAISGAVLAKQLNAPILLTETASLNEKTKAALDTLKPQNIYVVGGTGVISQAVRDALNSQNYNLIPLQGKNRYETNVAVAKQLVKLGVSPSNVMLVGGENFSDALSATPIAAAKGQILLLGANSDEALAPALSFIKDNSSQVTVIGTENSINDDSFKSLGAVKRVNGGADRFETNLNVLNEYKNDLKSDKLYVANASGDRYADALIAATLAGKDSAPLVLINNDAGDTGTSNAVDYIKNNIKNNTDLNVIGETGVVSDDIVSKINSSVPTTDEPTVKSITTNGLNQIKVVFNTQVDQETAEKLDSYEIEGSNLESGNAVVKLQEDKRTVLITFSQSYSQSKTVTFKVKNSIEDSTATHSITELEQKVTFFDNTAPTLESITPVGGNKLILQFSKPIRMKKSDLTSMKINRQSVANYGLNQSQSELEDQGTSVWASRVSLYFDNTLPTDTSLLFTMPNGTLNKVFDSAAGFAIKGSSVRFTVNEETGTPKVTNVTSDAAGNIYITYDRAMDKESALEDTNYKLNNDSVYASSSDIDFDPGSGDKVVKIENMDYKLKTGQNTLTVTNDVKDTYGNAVTETTMNFTLAGTTVKPQITSASMLDNKTIRIKFNKDVSSSYATNKSNYALYDSDGTNISYKIDDIDAVYSSDGGSNRTFDLKFTSDNELKDSSYKLTIKNIIDTTSDANVMDTVTKDITGVEDEGPQVTNIIKVYDEDSKLVVFFNKAMDEASITNPDNYRYLDGNGDTQKIPSSATITPSLDDKSVTIEFSSSYKVGGGSTSQYVTKISVANVKDRSGNTLSSPYSSEISQSNIGPSIIENSSKITLDGKDVKVRLSLTSPLDILSTDDFTVNGIHPDSGVVDGNDVVLTFRYKNNDTDSNNKAYEVLNAGISTTVNVSSGSSTDLAGRSIRSSSDKLYLPPVTFSSSWSVESNKSRGDNSTVNIVFRQDIDDDIENSYTNDFIFKNERTGETMKPLFVSVSGDTVSYKFAVGSILVGDNIDIKSNTASNIKIRSKGDSNGGNYVIYTPTVDDLNGRTIVAK